MRKILKDHLLVDVSISYFGDSTAQHGLYDNGAGFQLAMQNATIRFDRKQRCGILLCAFSEAWQGNRAYRMVRRPHNF